LKVLSILSCDTLYSGRWGADILGGIYGLLESRKFHTSHKARAIYLVFSKQKVKSNLVIMRELSR